MKTDEIRQRFLDYFKKLEHTVVRSDSLVPEKDPTVLFTGAGMNQFKDYFLGLKKDLKRAASSQKCLRTGDLDEVGKTAYHHSFFEMLGNFSFGDYFKKEAIQWAWDFLIDEMEIPKERLSVSIHQSDEEAYKIWRDVIKIPEKRIARLGDQTNFWPSNAPKEGPNGPCGPCSEIYYDQGEGVFGRPHQCSVDHDCGRFAEIWNLVFTQHDRQEGGRLVPLENKNIDTGMGLERLACVVQKKRRNFEIDIFQPIIEELERHLGWNREQESLARIYSIADYLRAVTFAISDGVIPGNEGRGYVIRKLIRRAVWQAHQATSREGLKAPMLYRGIPSIVKVMKGAYPDLVTAQKSVEDTVKGEEERFLKTLETGLVLLEQKISQAKSAGRKSLSGEEAFLLYDTYGFPDELTRNIAKDQGLEIDQTGFDDLMEAQRKRAKGASVIEGGIFVTSELEKILHELPKTEFLGYETTRSKSRVILARLDQGQGIIALDRTPFYAESGGQVGDTGMLRTPHFEARVEDTQKKDGYHLHHVQILKGEAKVGMEVEAQVDLDRRDRAMRNHTATHLLHAILREILGARVRQLGSWVHPDRLRFDYSFSRPLSEEEIRRIEDRTNEEILKDQLVQKEVKDFEAAKKEGALAFFGDKYGDRVRIVTVPGISKEFCGGTHCARTGQIGAFVIVSEASIASGVRRIEALTGEGALQYVQTLRSQVAEAAYQLKSSPADLVDRIQKLQARLKSLEKNLSEKSNRDFHPQELIEKAEKIGHVDLIVEKMSGLNREELRMFSDRLRSEAKQSVWVFFCTFQDKVHYLVGLSADLRESDIDAREIATAIASFLSGSGGGRKELAEGGGTNLRAFDQSWPNLLKTIKDYMKRGS